MAQLWTHSRLTARQKCPMKEYLRYDRELVPLKGNRALSIGTAVHKGLESQSVEEALKTFDLYQVENQDEANALEIAMATVEAMLKGYFARYPPLNLIGKEIAFELPMARPDGKMSRKLHIAGKMDAIAIEDGRQWLVEYKTASQIDKGYMKRLYVDGQITMYMMAARRLGYNPVGVIYRVLRKPSLRPSAKKCEGVAQFTARLTEDILSRPDWYFLEEKLYRSDFDLDAFEMDLWAQASLYEKQRKSGQHFKHTCNCAVYGECEYLPLCAGQAGAEALFTHQKAHSELEGAQ